MDFRNLPEDINVEVLLNYYEDAAIKVVYKGAHTRNAYHDIRGVESKKNGFVFSLGRKSLYNSMPEFLFHAIDRFDLPQYNQKERFVEECSKQEKEIEKAHNFFVPIDTLLFQIKLDVRKNLEDITLENKVLLDILTDALTEEQRNNRFIKQAIPYMPSLKYIRGNKTLLTLMLRKILLEERLTINVAKKNTEVVDPSPHYKDYVGSEIDELFVGNTFTEEVVTYDIYYWPEEECDENFLQLINEMDVFRRFIQDYFLSIEALLLFDVYKESDTLRLSDTTTYNYLSFNTNI